MISSQSLLRIFSRRGPSYCAGVVDQDVDGAKFLDRLSDQSRIKVGVSHIAGQIERLPSHLTNGLARGLAVGAAPMTSDVSPGLRQRDRDRGAQATARSGYKRILAFQLESLPESCLFSQLRLAGSSLGTSN